MIWPERCLKIFGEPGRWVVKVQDTALDTQVVSRVEHGGVALEVHETDKGKRVGYVLTAESCDVAIADHQYVALIYGDDGKLTVPYHDQYVRLLRFGDNYFWVLRNHG